MILLALSTVEKLQKVPLRNWGIVVLVILSVIVAMVLIKKLAGMNRIIIVIVGGTLLVVLLMTWVYQRNEPQFLTPLVDKIAPFFPAAPQPISQRPDKSDPEAAKKSRGQSSNGEPTPTTTAKPKVY